MSTLLLCLIPLVAGAVAWPLGARSPQATRLICVSALVLGLIGAVGMWVVLPGTTERWLAELQWPWIPQVGVRFHLAADGLSLVMVVLTYFLGLAAVLASWSSVHERVGFFHFNVMFVLAGVVGVFLAMDLFLFYVFWEVMLVPMYFLIGIWGSERRRYATLKFFLFTQAGGLLMLLAIVGLAWVHFRDTGVLTFGYPELLAAAPSPGVEMWLMLGFLVAFAVKLPAFPLHTWLPDAHTEAPTAGSVILAGLLLKTGGYGILRFVVPLFPDAALAVAPYAMGAGVVGILYGAVLAFSQTDLKRLVAYTSVSHLGFVLLGAFAFNELALQGVVMQMITHGLSTGGLFILVGFLYERLQSRDMRDMGGLWTLAPRMGVAAMLLAMASLGLPGLGNFVAELLVLVGAFQVAPLLTSLGAVGLVLATVYALWFVQATFHGPQRGRGLSDLGVRETALMAGLAVPLIWLGLQPQPVLELTRPALVESLARAGVGEAEQARRGEP